MGFRSRNTDNMKQYYGLKFGWPTSAEAIRRVLDSLNSQNTQPKWFAFCNKEDKFFYTDEPDEYINSPDWDYVPGTLKK